MFTGLIAELGKVEDLRREQNSYRLTIAAQTIPPLLKIGESVCCNGACLTVTKFDSQRFTVDVMPETARRTTIGSLKKGDRINLERTLHVGDGLDGHIVSGHVDGVGTIVKIRPEGIADVKNLRRVSVHLAAHHVIQTALILRRIVLIGNKKLLIAGDLIFLKKRPDDIPRKVHVRDKNDRRMLQAVPVKPDHIPV